MKWSYFPRNKMITDNLLDVIKVFENIGYSVEKSKRDKDKIKVPVLYGEVCKQSIFYSFKRNTNHRVLNQPLNLFLLSSYSEKTASLLFGGWIYGIIVSLYVFDFSPFSGCYKNNEICKFLVSISKS